MLFNRIYYEIKPYIPAAFRAQLRRMHASRKRAASEDIWPIRHEANGKPEGWRGWPDGKQFAFILTHDVERQEGLDKVEQLAQLEMRLGFRSSFYFVPEGDYQVSARIRNWLTDHSFEIGVHDLKHDGKLYRSRDGFYKSARHINHYLKQWGAVGFRSGFMLRNLEWIHELEILYDASTFDTDPFEPQPDGAGTIFPFWVPGRNGRPGYAELPYTLPQDSTLFLYLGEESIDIWKKKIDWIAKQGGMALMLTHPDYMSFAGERNRKQEFPVKFYEEFLHYVRSKYDGLFWHPLAKDVAAHVVANSRKPTDPAVSTNRPTPSVKQRTIWIDIDNTPHVPFFWPIARELKKRGYEVVFSARDAYQVCELATRFGIQYKKIGKHYGKSRFLKVVGTALRAAELLPFVLQTRPALGLSHGSRSQILLCNLLRIPTVLLLDYEHAKPFPLARPTWEIMPESILPIDAHWNPSRVRHYPGLKEDVYVPEFKPDLSLLRQLGLPESDIVVTVRPPATEAHYHNPESDGLFIEFMDLLMRTPGIRAVLLPRNQRQETYLNERFSDWFKDRKVIIPNMVVDGLSLLWCSDLVVSGGGTMNREAAALGIPVYSIFRGKLGAVDKSLRQEGRLTLIESKEDVHNKIAFQRRERTTPEGEKSRAALEEILRHVDEIMRDHYSG